MQFMMHTFKILDESVYDYTTLTQNIPKLFPSS